jgi:hypothetical protein
MPRRRSKSGRRHALDEGVEGVRRLDHLVGHQPRQPLRHAAAEEAQQEGADEGAQPVLGTVGGG